MSLSQNGRVQLRIYDARGLLLIARPFDSEESARSWYAEWKADRPATTFDIIAMVPAI